MCNFLHEPVKRIKSEGIAYKLFAKVNERYVPVCKQGYSLTKGEPVAWDKNKATNDIYGHGGDGFCMVMDKLSAKRAARGGWCWPVYVCKIKYKKGLGRFEEPLFTKSVTTIALCKEFQIIE